MICWLGEMICWLEEIIHLNFNFFLQLIIHFHYLIILSFPPTNNKWLHRLRETIHFSISVSNYLLTVNVDPISLKNKWTAVVDDNISSAEL